MSAYKPIQVLAGISISGTQSSKDLYRIDRQVHWYCPRCPTGVYPQLRYPKLMQVGWIP